MIRRSLLLKQYMIVGMTEGIIDMINSQSGLIRHLIPDVKTAVNEVYRVLRKQGFLSKKDLWFMRKQVNGLERKYFFDGFTAVNGLGVLTELLTEQAVKCNGEKKTAFTKLLDKVTKIIDHFDPDKTDDGGNCYDVAKTVEEIEKGRNEGNRANT